MKIFAQFFPLRIFYLALLPALFLPLSLSAADRPPIQNIESTGPAYDRYLKVIEETRHLLHTRDTAGLEALAKQLRESKEALEDGTWLLTRFYRNAVNVPSDNPEKAERAMAFYREWAEKSPQSITSQICLAEALTSYAWDARGSGYADSVSEEGRRLFKERLAEAWIVLLEAQKLEEKCPAWYSAAQTIGLGQGWDREKYMKLVDEALEKEPTYGRYYAITCYYLFPRCYGKKGDFEKWIAEKADLYPADQRDRQYARLVWMADTLGFDSEIIFAKGRLDWERTRRGFEDWIKADPDALAVRFQYLRFALFADDRETARAQFEATGGKYWPPLWEGEWSKFEGARDFAYGKGKNPFKQEKLSKIPPGLLKSGERFLHGFAGFMGGLLAGVFCLLLAKRQGQLAVGIAALLAAMILGTLGGTMLAFIPAAAIVLYLYFKPFGGPLETPGLPKPWPAFFWMFLVAAFNMLLQVGASIFIAIPMVATLNNFDDFTAQFYESPEIFQVVLNAAWISLLLLLVICGGRTAAGYRHRLGLLPFDWKKALLYLASAYLFIYLVGLGLQVFRDSKTEEAMEMMAYGMRYPFVFILCVILVVPLFEELLFRGFFFQTMCPQIGFLRTALAGSLVFTLCHVQYGWVGLVEVFLLSFSLYFLRWKTGSVIPSLVLHVFCNGLNTLLIFLHST